MNYNHRLQKAFLQAPTLPLSEDSKYILISDCHRGNGSSSDNFLKNQHLYFAALQHYYAQGFTYIELGDGDEKKRLYLLYGNHDIIKKSSKKAEQFFESYSCPSERKDLTLFPGITFYSGLILKDSEQQKDIYLTHGHQTDFLNSNLWQLSRFLVRYVWGPAERMGFHDPTSAAKKNKKKRRAEEKLTNWAQSKGHILNTGHTHRPALSEADAYYYNCGSCVHPYSITCLELEHMHIRLVKWALTAKPDMSLSVAREVLSQTVPLANPSLME